MVAVDHAMGMMDVPITVRKKNVTDDPRILRIDVINVHFVNFAAIKAVSDVVGVQLHRPAPVEDNFPCQIDVEFERVAITSKRLAILSRTTRTIFDVIGRGRFLDLWSSFSTLFSSVQSCEQT